MPSLDLLRDAIALVFGYLCGSIPFGLILTRLAGGPDIRTVGSGNIGATNVLRTGKKWLAAATLLGDMLKGTVAVLVADWMFGREAAIAAGLGAFLGHLFPVWLGFKGGKGVATYIGVLLGLQCWDALMCFCFAWLIVAFAFRFSSAAALTGAVIVPWVLWFDGNRHEAALFLVLSTLLFVMHRANIARLVNGTESRIGQKS
jgi:glycerol-3-phosphate acyltransferase PlsY